VRHRLRGVHLRSHLLQRLCGRQLDRAADHAQQPVGGVPRRGVQHGGVPGGAVTPARRVVGPRRRAAAHSQDRLLRRALRAAVGRGREDDLRAVRDVPAAARAPLPRVPALRAPHGPPLPLDQQLRGGMEPEVLPAVPVLHSRAVRLLHADDSAGLAVPV